MTTRHWLVILSLLLGVATAHAGDPRRVLVLYSNGRLLPANIEIEHEISRVLAGTSRKTVQILSEFLEFTEFPATSYEPTLTTYLHEKYATRRPDVVVAVARESLDFVLRHRARTVSGGSDRPCGACSSRTWTSSRRCLPTWSAYRSSTTPPAPIEQALRWHPKAHHCLIVTGCDRRATANGRRCCG